MQAVCTPILPVGAFTLLGDTPTLCRMDVYRIRWLNFRRLAGHRGGVSEAARKLGKSQGQVSHFGGERPIKNIGHDIAREIEAAYGKSHGWLDQVHEPEAAGDEPVNNGSGDMGQASQSVLLDAAMLARAESWVRFEEKAGVRFQSVRRAERLIELYSAIAANGGNLTPEQAERLIDEARHRMQQGATKRGRPKANDGGGTA